MAMTRAQRAQEAKKRYKPKVKTPQICENCVKSFLTCKPMQRYCNDAPCQRARKKQNLVDYIEREAKK